MVHVGGLAESTREAYKSCASSNSSLLIALHSFQVHYYSINAQFRAWTNCFITLPTDIYAAVVLVTKIKLAMLRQLHLVEILTSEFMHSRQELYQERLVFQLSPLLLLLEALPKNHVVKICSHPKLMSFRGFSTYVVTVPPPLLFIRNKTLVIWLSPDILPEL